MRSILALFGLLSAFMLVFAIPLENSVALEKRQNGGATIPDFAATLTQIQDLISGLLSGLAGSATGGGGAP